jgi:hypothetical protein
MESKIEETCQEFNKIVQNPRSTLTRGLCGPSGFPIQRFVTGA